MTKPRMTRRQFLKISAFSAASTIALPALGLAAVAATPSREAQAAAQQPQGPAIPQPTFNPIASNTTFGPLADISMGWDGTLWGIDAQGAPHIFDSINNVWAQHGDGIDAAAQLGDPLYFFKGDSFVTATQSTDLVISAPKTIAAEWPALPDSFKLGIVGAANFNNLGLILFNGGRLVSTDGSIVLTSLTSLANWPQTPAWKDGVIDAVYCAAVNQPIILIRNNQFIGIDPVAKTVTSQPAALSTLAPLTGKFPADWLASGFDAATVAGNYQIGFKGTALVIQINSATAAAQPRYISSFFTKGWPATWHPVLSHAPNGRDGNLWSVLPQSQGGWVMQHDGDLWTRLPNQADHVGVGQDNTVMLASAQRLWKFTGAFDGSGFTPVSQPGNLIQVSLGNANAVFARDTSGNVFSFDPNAGALTQNTDVGTVAHIATSNDGALWHAKPNDANMHRQLVGSGSPPEAITVKQNLVTSVNKVAGTGFGAAHCLAQDGTGNTQAYRYDSPYVFKTSMHYDTGPWNESSTRIEQGAGLLFFTDTVLADDNPLIIKTRIVGIDAHTGAEVANTPWLTNPPIYIQPVFDPLHSLVYVVTSSQDDADMTTPGQLLALDARTLAVKWTFNTPTGIDALPALNGSRLCISDRTGTLYLFDTTAALATNTATVQPVWTTKVAVNSAQTHRIATPTFVGDVEDLIYTALWDCNYSTVSGNWTIQGTWVSYRVPDGSANDRVPLHTTTTPQAGLEMFLTAPAHGKLNIAPSGTPQLSPALFYNCFDAVIGIGAGPTTKTFSLSSDYITTGLVYDIDSNVLWFGSGNGTLYCLNTDLTTINHTPYTPVQQNSIYTTPVIYRDTLGNATVLFGLNEGQNLIGFDPVNGNMASVSTGATRVYALSKSDTNGVVYVGGSNGGATGTGQFPQVFGIRVDDLPQAERDFIIESQLMQDPDQNATGSGSTADPNNPIPPSKARYQTHLTVVDDQKNPQANETVKIWADVDGTVITVKGTQYTIGPADPAYATVQTDIDGSVVIVSDAADINTSALRVWASFMDPYERIVVYPDHEWHGRATNSYNDPSADLNKPDPSRPNFSTAYNYKGTQLFTADEKSQPSPGNAPANIANAVGQMNTGLKPGGGTPAAIAGALKTLHASDANAPYVAYTTLPGMHYAPSNARAKRTATVYAPFGLHFGKDTSGNRTYKSLTHSDARSAIDTLTGAAWDPNNPNDATPAGSLASTQPVTLVVRRSENLFTDFWNWLVSQFQKLVSEIENVIVSVAEDIMVGINFIVNGVEKAFKAIIKVIDDVCNAIGSFFMQLIKAIEDVIEALSVLFHFGEIIWTHNWLKQQFSTLADDVSGVIKNTLKPILTNAITDAEKGVATFFDNFEATLGVNDQVNNVQGSGATPHSAYTVNGSSNSVQASWGTQSMKGGMSSGGSGVSVRQGAFVAPSQTGDGPSPDLVTFFTNFWTSLTTGQNADDFNKLKTDFANLFTATSAKSFFNTLLKTLIDAVETLVELALTFAGDLLLGICDFVDQAIDFILNQVLNFAIEIPVISWLYKLLFNEDLTILNAAMLVTAIPVTLVFRLIEGQYPSQVLQPLNPFTPTPATRKGLFGRAVSSTAAPIAVQKALLITNGVLSVIYGIASAIGDGSDDASPWVGRVSAGLGFVMMCLSAPWISSDSKDIGDLDWEPWGFGITFSLVYIVSLPDFKNSGGKPIADQALLPFMTSALSAMLLLFDILQFVEEGKRNPTTNLGFASSLLTTVPGLLNAIKLLGEYGATLVVTADLVCNAANLFVAILESNSLSVAQPLVRRWYMPWIAVNGVSP